MESWLKAAEGLLEVVDRKAKQVVGEKADEYSDSQSPGIFQIFLVWMSGCHFILHLLLDQLFVCLLKIKIWYHRPGICLLLIHNQSD
uniref:Golgin-84 n=1 Tax=Rhizophora mucronata TaxID=61149 RepID=A0A2P2MN55_RHIMU